ncbi:MAG: antibiotic biosynthesis monooxygenase [Pyrinomonadaceae bacterium]
MFTVIYRWRIKPELEEQFIESWSEITGHYLENFDGALGSRLHRGGDGLWYAYAQWQSDAHRQRAFQNAPKMPAGEKMREAIEESFPETPLEIVSDFLISPVKTEL